MEIFGDPEAFCNAAETLGTIDAALIHDAVTEAVRAGFMISFSRARDGFALRIGVYHGDEKNQRWFEDQASVERALHGVVSAAKSVSAQGQQKPLPTAKKGK